MSVFIWIEHGECKPKGYLRSIPKAAKLINAHPNTIRKHIKKDGVYLNKKGILYKTKEL